MRLEEKQNQLARLVDPAFAMKLAQVLAGLTHRRLGPSLPFLRAVTGAFTGENAYTCKPTFQVPACPPHPHRSRLHSCCPRVLSLTLSPAKLPRENILAISSPPRGASGGIGERVFGYILFWIWGVAYSLSGERASGNKKTVSVVCVVVCAAECNPNITPLIAAISAVIACSRRANTKSLPGEHSPEDPGSGDVPRQQHPF